MGGGEDAAGITDVMRQQSFRTQSAEYKQYSSLSLSLSLSLFPELFMSALTFFFTVLYFPVLEAVRRRKKKSPEKEDLAVQLQHTVGKESRVVQKLSRVSDDVGSGSCSSKRLL